MHIVTCSPDAVYHILRNLKLNLSFDTSLIQTTPSFDAEWLWGAEDYERFYVIGALNRSSQNFAQILRTTSRPEIFSRTYMEPPFTTFTGLTRLRQYPF